MVIWISSKMVWSSLVFIVVFGCLSFSETSPRRSGVFLKNVFTNLTHSFARAVRVDLSSAVSQGNLPHINLGSAGSKVRDIGAATSYGVGQLEFMRISIGVSAAKAKTSEAVNGLINSNLGRIQQGIQFSRVKRDEVSVATSLNEVSGVGAKSVMGSTGANAGPVATSISLGEILLAARNSFSGVNAGAVAAHAGNTDASNTFSNSNIVGNVGFIGRNGGEGDESIKEEDEDDGGKAVGEDKENEETSEDEQPQDEE